MELDHSMWSALHDYLFIDDNKFSTKEGNQWSYSSRFKLLVNWFTSHKLPFNRKNFVLFLKEMQDSISPKTGKPYTPSYLNKFITMAKLLDKMLAINEMDKFSYFNEKANKPKRKIISADLAKRLAELNFEYKRFKEYINQRQETLIKLMHTTGPRIDEALSLEWRDIGTDPWHVTYRDTKNGEDRSVPISEKTYNLLINLPKRSSTYVFASARTANKLRGKQINDDLKQRMKALELDVEVHNHLFRHSFITTMRQAGADVADIAFLAGHKDPKSTMRYINSMLDYYATIIYIHPLNQEDIDLEVIGQKMLSMAMRLINKELFKGRVADHEPNSICVMVKKIVNR